MIFAPFALSRRITVPALCPGAITHHHSPFERARKKYLLCPFRCCCFWLVIVVAIVDGILVFAPVFLPIFALFLHDRLCYCRLSFCMERMSVDARASWKWSERKSDCPDRTNKTGKGFDYVCPKILLALLFLVVLHYRTTMFPTVHIDLLSFPLYYACVAGRVCVCMWGLYTIRVDRARQGRMVL